MGVYSKKASETHKTQFKHSTAKYEDFDSISTAVQSVP